MKRVSTDGAPKADAILSQAIISSGLIFVAGQIHMDAEGKLVEGSIKEMTAQIMKNIGVILKAADSGLEKVVKVTIYVTDMKLVPELNEVYPNYFSDPLPAREAITVKELPLGASIEMSIIAEV